MAGGLASALAGSAMAVVLAGCTPQSKSAPDATSLQDAQPLAQDGGGKAEVDERDGADHRVEPIPVPPYAPVPPVEKP